MASRKRNANQGNNQGGGVDQEHREVDFKVKNLLIDLVRQHPAIYDKSHRIISVQTYGMKYGMK